MKMPTEEELEREEKIENLAKIAAEKEQLEDTAEKSKELLKEYEDLSKIKGKKIGDE